MGVKSKVSVNDLLIAQEKWHNGGKVKGGYDCVSAGALICDAGPELLANLRALPFLEDHGEPMARSSELVRGQNVRKDLAEYYKNIHDRMLLGKRVKSNKHRKARNARKRAAVNARKHASA